MTSLRRELSPWVGILLTLIVAGITFAFGYGALAERTERNETDIADKVNRARFDDLRDDVREIKRGVDALLRRAPQK